MEHGLECLHVIVCVDDLIISGNTTALIQSFKDYLSQCFHMKDLRISKYFFGIKLARSPTGIYLCQQKYVLDILKDTGLLAAKPVTFPIEQNHRLALDKSDYMREVHAYRRLVGRLIYLSNTRPDLSYAIHILSQFMHKPRSAHWEAALRVLHYLKGTVGHGILLRADTDLTVTAWCDADWAGCLVTRRSLTGWFIQLGGSSISWKTKKQKMVSLSSAEAEYRAMTFTLKEILWLCALLKSLGVRFTSPIPLFCDNQTAIHISANPVFHERTKHVETNCHFVRDEIVKGTIATQHGPTKAQLADMFTKALGSREFESFLGKLGICNLHAPDRGRV